MLELQCFGPNLVTFFSLAGSILPTVFRTPILTCSDLICGVMMVIPVP